MSRLRPIALLLALATATAAAAWWPQPAADAIGPWTERLERLTPADPLAYFELAEEVADRADDEPQRDLARHLFGLAGALDPQRLGRSACLALAQLEPNENARRRLLALGALLDRRAGGVAPPQLSGAVDINPEAALAVSEAISYYRKGDGSRALKLLERPGAMDLLDAWGGVIFPGGATRFIEDCRIHRGSSKPTLSPRENLELLRFEAAILAGDSRSWSADLLLTEGRPLIEVDPDRLDEALGANGSMPCFRDGRWVACD